MDQSNNSILPTVISSVLSLIAVIVTAYMAIAKARGENRNARELSDREQNVDLVEDLQASNKELRSEFNKLLGKFNDTQLSNAELKAEVASMRIQKEQWQRERDIWQKERETWQQERANFERERKELMDRIRKLEEDQNENKRRPKS